MTIGQFELLPAVERIVRAKRRRSGISVNGREINSMAKVLLDLNACGVADIYIPPSRSKSGFIRDSFRFLHEFKHSTCRWNQWRPCTSADIRPLEK